MERHRSKTNLELHINFNKMTPVQVAMNLLKL